MYHVRTASAKIPLQEEHLDEDRVDRVREDVQAETLRPQKRDEGGLEGKSESESEPKSSYREQRKYAGPLSRCNSDKY